jgi:hypothetical protein
MDYSDRLQREGQALDDALGTLDGPIRAVLLGRDMTHAKEVEAALRASWRVSTLLHYSRPVDAYRFGGGVHVVIALRGHQGFQPMLNAAANAGIPIADLRQCG